MHAWLLSHVGLFSAPWTVVYQAPLSMGFFQARILEWIAISYSKGSSQPRDGTLCNPYPSPAFQADFYPLSHQGNLMN